MGPDPEKVEIFFVTQASSSPLLGLAHTAVSGYQNIKSSNIDEKAVLRSQLGKTPRTYFVLSNFDGAAFEHIRERGCPILGPHVILHYLRENAALPAWPLPLFSAAMQKAVVSFTSFTVDMRTKLMEKVRMMHGEVTGDFTSSVNVIVSPKIGSKKYIVGNQVGVPVVLPSWIEESWRLSEIQDPFDALAESFLLKFKIPVFHNLVISVSGLSSDDREEASHLIEAHGGRYSGDLKVGECSHLVINKPVGEKYHYAKRWKVQIVTSNWLFDSIDRGYAQEEINYKLAADSETETRPQGSSTPEEQGVKRKRTVPAPDISVIGHPNRTRITESRMDESLASNNQSDSLPPNASDTLAPQPLAGCLVAALGRINRREEIAHKLLDLGGRLCDSGVEVLSEDVTHMLVADLASLAPEHLQFEAGLPVVTLQWLLDCHKSRSRLPEADYAVSMPRACEQRQPGPEEEKENTEVAVEREGTTANIDADEMAMINQYFEGCDTESDMPGPIEDTAALSATVIPDAPESSESDSKPAVFSGARFCFHASANLVISAAFADRLRRLLTENGAEALDSSPASSDYIVAHFFASDLPELSGPRLVTLAWVYSCLESERVLLDEPDIACLPGLIRPMRTRGSEDERVLRAVLEGCVLCVSGFQGALRTCLSLFAEAMGARMQEGLMRKALPRKGIAASTHLVCAQPRGDKFAAALRWSIPVVSKEWLFACAERRTRLPCQDFPVLPGSPDRAPPLENSASNVSLPEHGFRTPTAPAPRRAQNAAATESPRAGLDTPGKFLHEGFQPKFDLNSMAEMLQTPERNRKPDRPETPLTEKVHKGLANALRLSKLQSPTSGNAGPPEKAPGPLAEAVIYVAKKLSGRQCELNSVVQRLDGQYKWRYDSTQVTHVVFEGPPTDAQQREELRSARRDKKFVVHPAWVHACLEKNSRINEGLFPPDVRPAMRLELTASPAQEPPPTLRSLDPSAQEDSFHIDLRPPPDSLPTEVPEEISEASVMEPTSPRCEILENLDQHLENSTNNGKRRRRRRSESLADSGATGGGEVGGDVGSEIGSSLDLLSEEGASEDQIHPSQSLQVHWRYDDSDGHTLSAGHHLSSPGLPRVSSLSAPVAEPRLFVLSGFPEADRARLAALIERQGAAVQESRDMADLARVTHLVVQKPTRGEKFMTCAAAGKWIVHRSFVEAASSAGWPGEERYEWGGPGTEPILASQSPLERSLARAARRWRVAGGGAFSGWRVVFFSGLGGGSRLDSFARILRAGGAEVLAEGPPFPPAEGVTHAFVEIRKGSALEAGQLPPGFLWLKHEFLSAFLTEETTPDSADFVLADRRTDRGRQRGGKRTAEPEPVPESSGRVTRASKRLRRK